MDNLAELALSKLATLLMYAFFVPSLKIVDITDEVAQSSDVEMDNDAVVVDEVNAKRLVNKDTRVSVARSIFA